MDPRTGKAYRWREFLEGVRLIGVMQARQALMVAGAGAVEHMSKEDRERWFKRNLQAAGWDTNG